MNDLAGDDQVVLERIPGERRHDQALEAHEAEQDSGEGHHPTAAPPEELPEKVAAPGQIRGDEVRQMALGIQLPTSERGQRRENEKGDGKPEESQRSEQVIDR